MDLFSKVKKTGTVLLLLLLVNLLCTACGKSDKIVSDNDSQEVELTDDEKQEIRRSYLIDSIRNNFAIANETTDKIYYFKGEKKRYKPYLYIFDINSEKCDSLKDAFPVIYDYRSIDDRIVMIEHNPNAGEGSLGVFASTAPQFFVDEYNISTGKIKCLVNGCAEAEFLDAFDEKTGDGYVKLKVGEMVVLNPDAPSYDMEFDIKYNTINLTKNSKSEISNRPVIDPFEAALNDNETPKQLTNARKLYKDFKDNLTIDEMVDMAFIFWEFGDKQEKEIAVALMKKSVKKNKKRVQDRIYNQSEIGWAMPGTPERPEGLPEP